MNKRILIPHGGNDDFQTPIYLCKFIIEHFKPRGRILEPCCGDGNFLKTLQEKSNWVDWFEIKKGKDFLRPDIFGHWDWIMTNPPFSKFRAFLIQSMSVANNIVFIQAINATFYKARLSDIQIMNFGIKEILCFDTPKEFPQGGLQMGCIHYKKNWKGDIHFELPKPSTKE